VTGIRKNGLDSAARARAFSIEVAAAKEEKGHDMLRNKHIAGQRIMLQAFIRYWLTLNDGLIESCCKLADFPYPNQFSDETINICIPLAAVLEVAYAEHSQLDHVREDLVKAIQLTREEIGGKHRLSSGTAFKTNHPTIR
jgi:hypothetical protein